MKKEIAVWYVKHFLPKYHLKKKPIRKPKVKKTSQRPDYAG